MGDLDQAIALCQEHLEGQAGNMNGHVVYGQALFDAGRYDEAENTFATALTRDPENLIALRHLGDIARTNNDAPKALDWYNRVLDADPRNDEILGFIEELKAMVVVVPAAPTEVPADRAPTPLATAAVPQTHDGKTVEIVAPKRPSQSNATPIAPIEMVEPSAPEKRMSLLDMTLDLGGVGESGVGAGLGAGMDIMPTSEPPAPRATTPVAQPTMELDNGLGWDMGAVDLTPVDGIDATSSEPATAETPQVFVTETMAELYLQQGFRDEALQVYRQLAEQNPNDASIRERIRNLESGDRASMSFNAISDDVPDVAPGTDSLIMMSDAPGDAVAADAAPTFEELPLIDSFSESGPSRISTDLSVGELDLPAEEPQSAPTPIVTPAVVSARAFFATLAQRRAVRRDGTPAHPMAAVNGDQAVVAVPAATGGGSVDTLFGASPADADDAMGRALATAVGAVDAAPIRGKPTQVAGSELTLDSVFRGDSSMRSSGSGQQRPSEVLKFDQFFETDAPAKPPETAADPNAPPASPADDAQFSSWLQGLKGQ